MQASLLVIESIAAIFSLWCVYLAGNNRILNWPISMIASVLYFGVFYENRFYSDAYLQVIFFIFQCYGWYSWIQQSKLKNHSNSNNHPSIRSLTPKLLLISIPLFFVFWGCYYFAYLQLFDTSDVLFVAGILPYETVFCKNKNSFFITNFFPLVSDEMDILAT